MCPWVSKIARFSLEIQTHSLPVRPTIALRAASTDLHSSLSSASFWMEPQLWPKPLISVSIVHGHVFLGLSCWRLNRFLKKTRGVTSFEVLIIS